ncbi:ribonucleoside hydrolase RihC [Malacoplasma iowae]|uniref:ribonucleoside hydrolase RihC n=1 Tax=Malacoplasma iowae TaxID=2116 RepID=UPI002A188128|nr:ribonucleoside hydrolase RihC [Malacoplasma iowae]WPL38567.1 ribonucleoside hydrolase RihC [Malacoplasma iowae]WPL40403.1 ribonucleoside hydrolase RihC [Malacoplasma iowae]
MEKEKIIIDTDPGIDDAIAIIFALHNPKFDIKLISTVAGNVDVEKTTTNALKILSEYKKDIPVAKGSESPLINTLETCESVHGNTGMDGYDFKKPIKSCLKNHAVNEIYKILKESDTPITIVALAPLTNIALLLSLYKDVKHKIKRIVLMGGAINRGNSSPSAEFNFYIDPEAAKIVIDSKLDIVIVPLEIGMKSLIYKDDCEKFKNLNKTGEIFYNLFKHYRGGSLQTGLKMYDPTVITYLDKPEIFTTQKVFVDIETTKTYVYGHSIIDLKNKLNKTPNVTICTDIDANKFIEWFNNSMKMCE